MQQTEYIFPVLVVDKVDLVYQEETNRPDDGRIVSEPPAHGVPLLQKVHCMYALRKGVNNTENDFCGQST